MSIALLEYVQDMLIMFLQSTAAFMPDFELCVIFLSLFITVLQFNQSVLHDIFLHMH